MELNSLWFTLIAVLFIGFFFLEGFDYGVGILMPFLGRNDRERRVIINTIGPFWDGNEVWLITAGGAMFAAFPHWYATMFSGFYLALVLMLLALIVRGVAFEFRSKDRHPRWRRLWDWLLCGGSFIPALLWGVALANVVRGVPIDAEMTYVGTFFDLINPLSLVAGVAALVAFMLHGAIFLSLKTDGEVRARAEQAASRLWSVVAIVIALLVILGYTQTDIFRQLGINPGVSALGSGAALLAVGWLLRDKNYSWAFAAMGLHLALTIITVFRGLYPRVLVSSLDPAYSLTITNASSSEYTLQIMTIVALIFVPIVVLYQAWSYWVFRKRISAESKLEY